MTDAMVPSQRFPAPDDATAERGYRRTTFAIAAGTGLASFAMNFWWPFLPLYLRELGATSDANALFWVAVATAVQGVARLVSGPFWGVLSDRYGRKLMFVRALFAATLTTVVAAVAHAPWVIVISLAMQGLFSGFVPAAIALASVSVPDGRLQRSLGTVTGGQYLGNTLGPALGALLATTLGFRLTIVAGAMLPALAAAWVLMVVPRDVITREARPAAGAAGGSEAPHRAMGGFPRELYVAIGMYFWLFALNQLVRLSTPIALEDIAGEGGARAASGIAFTLSGAAAVIGVMVLARFSNTRWSARRSLIIFSLAAAAAHPMLAIGGSVPVFIAGFVLVSLINGAAMPATNSLIAQSAHPSRRGTAFGLASSAQAVAFMVGPMAAAGFAAVSLSLGFLVVAGLFGGLAVMVALLLRDVPSAPRVEVLQSVS